MSSNLNHIGMDFQPELIGVIFLTPALVPKKVTPAHALFGNLHSDSCFHCENLKAISILRHEAK